MAGKLTWWHVLVAAGFFFLFVTMMNVFAWVFVAHLW